MWKQHCDSEVRAGVRSGASVPGAGLGTALLGHCTGCSPSLLPTLSQWKHAQSWWFLQDLRPRSFTAAFSAFAKALASARTHRVCGWAAFGVLRKEAAVCHFPTALDFFFLEKKKKECLHRVIMLIERVWFFFFFPSDTKLGWNANIALTARSQPISLVFSFSCPYLPADS